MDSISSLVIFEIIVCLIVLGSLFLASLGNRTSASKRKKSNRYKECKPQTYTKKELEEVRKQEFELKYSKALTYYQIAIEHYKKLFEGHDVKEYVLAADESVLVIDDKLITYIGLIVTDFIPNEKYTGFITTLIEELTYNDIKKFNATKFGEIFPNPFYDLKVMIFYNLEYKYTQKNFTHFFIVNEKLPCLNLLERARAWKGVFFYYVVLEIFDERGSAYTVKYTQQKDTEKFAQRCCNELENGRFYSEPHNKINHIEFLEKLKEIKKDHNFKHNDRPFTLRGHLRYFVISEQSQSYDCQSRGYEIIIAAKQHKYDDIERKDFGRFTGKWKSELRLLEICKKIFGEDDVIYQYSPSFLGQMSYDVYIISKKTAIEYQGKQHYEPVEFFGGEEHFNAQIERDEKKLSLSKKNNVTLVYVRYDEILSEELIIEKINNETQ